MNPENLEKEVYEIVSKAKKISQTEIYKKIDVNDFDVAEALFELEKKGKIKAPERKVIVREDGGLLSIKVYTV